MRLAAVTRTASLMLALLGALALASPPAHANPRREHGFIPASLHALPAPETDAEQLTTPVMSGAAQRQYGLDSQILRRYWLRAGVPGAKASAPPRIVAENFLSTHAAELGLAADALNKELEFASEKETPSGTHLRWNQTVQGVPVYRSEIVVKVNTRGEVSSVQNNLHPDMKLAVTPMLTAAAAIVSANGVVQPTGRAIAPPAASLTVVDSRTGPRLAWLVKMPVEAPQGDWWVFVDALTGAAFGAEDHMVYAEGTGRVFDPDPMSKMGDSSYVDSNDADSAVPFPAAYDTRPLHDITLSAGVYSLSGPYAQLIDDESPTFAPVTATHPDSFQFQRSAQGFEDVMCYYHLDNSQRYIQSLGFMNINNRVQPVDSHGLSGADNSHYVPSTGHLAFGEGGIDDDEDADVIWHEYGHSIQDNIVPGWGGGQEGQMGEGWGDYWAASYSRSLYPNFQSNRVFTWDGNGETWTGRLLIDTALHYPANCCGEVHDSGTLWCSGLTDCWNHVGRAVMDRIVLDHHFSLGTSATMADAANQIIQSDIDLYAGAHLSTLVERFGFWGFVNPADFIPAIAHTKLANSENIAGPYAVVATVTSTRPLAAGFPRLYWGFGAAITDSVDMTPTGNPNEYTANIPGPGLDTDVRYYIRATDNSGGSAVAPSTAPATPYVFHVGTDVTAPVIVHTPITLAPALTWPATVQANVTDDLAVNTTSVTVDWTLNAVAQTPFTLARIGVTNNYSGAFAAVAVVPGDVVTYHITAQDLAASPNTGRSPAVGENSFTITAALGVVLVLDDDEVAKRTETKVIHDEKNPALTTTLVPASVDAVLSANKIAATLNALGYVATVEPSATSNPATWPGYSFIVSSSGGNTGPVANATYRAAVEAYVAAGHKLIVEGGEVGYDAISTPGYPTFAANVLHGNTWAADNAGTLVRVSAQSTHPVATTPNALPASIPITYVDFGTEDSYAPIAPAVAVYGTTTQVGNVGIGAFDDNLAPQAGQIVTFAFDFKDLTDSTTAAHLLENAAHYLLAPEPGPHSTLKGRVAVGSAWGGGGISVTLVPGSHVTTTAPDGTFEFDSLYAGSYSVSAALAGYTGSARNVTLAQDAESYVVLTLFTAASTNACATPAQAIPDNNVTGITNSVVVGPSFAVTSLECSVDITHTWRGDLIVELRHGATNVRLHNRTGSSADNLIGTYPTTLTPASSMAPFNGLTSDGTWTLFVSDNASTDTGTLNNWCVVLHGAADTTQTVGVQPGPQALALEFAPAWPNPSRGGPVSLSFTLPKSAAAQVALYDVGGRLVRTVADRVFPAGRNALLWDGNSDHGSALRPGLYMVRFTTAGMTATRRLVVLQ